MRQIRLREILILVALIALSIALGMTIERARHAPTTRPVPFTSPLGSFW